MGEIVADRRIQWDWSVGHKRRWEQHAHCLRESHARLLGLYNLKTKSPLNFKQEFDLCHMLLCRTYYRVWALGLTPSKNKEVRRIYLSPMS